MTYGRAVFGDNQFLGVNHANQAKAAEHFKRFSDPDQIIEVLGAAYQAGLRDFMFTTHERYEPVFEEIRRSNLFAGMHYTPCLPYAHKYWNRLSNDGLIAAIAMPLWQANPMKIIPAGLGMLVGKNRGLISLVTQIEILMCKGLPVRGIFLQNAATDFLLAMQRLRELEGFAIAVERLGVEPGFITMNHPAAVKALTVEIGLTNPWICSNFNVGGFRMNPSPNVVRASFATSGTRNMAMSVFSSLGASATVALDNVLDAVCTGSVDAILFGSASPQNIAKNAKLIFEKPIL